MAKNYLYSKAIPLEVVEATCDSKKYSAHSMNKENQVKKDKIYVKYAGIWLLTFLV